MTGNELLTSGARSSRVVGQVLAVTQRRPLLVEQRDGVLLSRGALGGQITLAATVDRARRCWRHAVEIAVAATAGQHRTTDHGRRNRHHQYPAHALELH